MKINPNVSGGDTALSSLTPGDCFDGPDGAPAMLTQGINDGTGNLFYVSLGNGAVGPLEPSHTVRPRPDLEVAQSGGSAPAPAAAHGPAAQRAAQGQARVVTPSRTK